MAKHRKNHPDHGDVEITIDGQKHTGSYELTGGRAATIKVSAHGFPGSKVAALGNTRLATRAEMLLHEIVSQARPTKP